MIDASVGVLTPLNLQLYDGVATKYPRALVRDNSGTLLFTVNLNHVGNGMYLGNFTPPVAGYYHATFIVYSDAGHTIEDFAYTYDTESFRANDPAQDIQDIVDGVWDEPLADHLDTGSTGAALNDILNGMDPAVIASAVWEELIVDHTNPGTYGLYIDVIREFVEGNNNELLSGVHGLAELKQNIYDSMILLQNEVNVNQVKIEAIIPQISLTEANLKNDIDQNEAKIDALSLQLTGTQSSIISEINVNETKIDALQASVSSLSNNTTVRFIVPEQLVRPETGSKTYQFHLRLFDDLGNPEAPDSIPTIRIRDLTSLVDIVSGVNMTQDGVKVGAYFYNHTITSGTDTHHFLVEVTVVEGGVTRYIPATTEVTEFAADLNAIQTQLNSIGLDVDDIQNNVNNPVFGLSALEDKIQTTINEVNQNEAKIDAVKVKTDNLPSNPVDVTDLAPVIAAVYTRPDLAQIVTQLNLVKAAIMGLDNRSNTDVYDAIDYSGLLQSNDPRLDNLDAAISSRSTLTAANVWTYATRTLTNFSLPAADVKQIWDYLVSSMTVSGSIGKLIKDMLDATVSSRATQAQVSSLLGGIAQESTLNTVLGTLNTEINQNEVKLNTVITLLNLVKPQTDLIVAGGATQVQLVSESNTIQALINALNLLTVGVKAKTDNLPAQPASELTVQAIPTNPVLATDPRLNNLDVAVSTRSTLSPTHLLPLAKTTDVTAAKNDIISEVNQNETSLNSLHTKVNDIPTNSEAAALVAPLAKTSELNDAKDDIIAAMPGGGVPPTPAQIWSYGNRTLTQPVQIESSQYADIAKKADAIDYINCMSTIFRANTNEQEVIAWAEKNGQRVAGSSNCSIVVKDANGAVKWNASASTPNADGIYKFVNPITITAANNYYIVITIEVDGSPRVSQQSFFTVG